MPVYTVTQVAKYLKDTVEGDRILADLLVSGEVSNLSRSAAGHCYFTLKDVDSQLRCVAFRDAVGIDMLDNGVAVTAQGHISFYQARGDLQLITELVASDGVGELHMEFLRIRAKLQEEGLFDESRKRPLPAFPKRIAVVTSRAGAVLHDIINVLSRRYPLVELLFLHTPVQGEQAAEGIVAAFRTLSLETDLDLVILARGGGSMEELAAFNQEAVARAIHASHVPVVSAVGHETDTTIADFVADVRAPTPSAAAELVTPDIVDLQRRVAEQRNTLASEVLGQLALGQDSLRYVTSRLDRLAPDIASYRLRIDELTRVALATVRQGTALLREQVHSRGLQLGSLQPRNTLSRGYALVQRTANGRPVSSVGDVAPGDGIGVQVSDGSFQGQVLGGPPAPPKSRPGRTAKKRIVPTEQGTLWEQGLPPSETGVSL